MYHKITMTADFVLYLLLASLVSTAMAFPSRKSMDFDNLAKGNFQEVEPHQKRASHCFDADDDLFYCLFEKIYGACDLYENMKKSCAKTCGFC